jgi:hypothetical protein
LINTIFPSHFRYLKCHKANTLLVAFGGNGEKQNTSVPSKYLLYQVLKILTTLCDPVIAMTNESDVKNKESHNEKNKHDIIQELVQNSNLQVIFCSIFFTAKHIYYVPFRP